MEAQKLTHTTATREPASKACQQQTYEKPQNQELLVNQQILQLPCDPPASSLPLRSTVEVGSPVWVHVTSAFYRTVDPEDCEVLQVEEVRNSEKTEIYNLKKRQLERRLGARAGLGVDEVLFHGTSASTVNSILIQGFLRDFNQVSAYGTGTYFARDAQYAISTRYSKPDSKKHQCMIMANVLVGEPCQGHR
jgi:hypothetical protein